MSDLKDKTLSMKILVAYDKPAVLIKNEIYTPIHSGRALVNQNLNDENISKEDIAWLCENMIGDDNGDNISHLNGFFCEFTSIYWAWKNYDKLGNPDYIGFTHYKKQFVLDEWDRNVFYHYNTLEECFLNTFDTYYKHKINSILNNAYAIVPNPRYLNICVQKNLENKEYKNFNPIFLDTLKTIIHQKFEEYVSDFEEYLSQKQLFCSNLFIMPKELFFEYCEFLFSILFMLYEQINSFSLKSSQKRSYVYMAELLTGVFFTYLKKQRAIKQLPIAIIKNTDLDDKTKLTHSFSVVHKNKDCPSSPKISVIMPCYNRQAYIAEAIESILIQTYENFEFLIIDDCSTDKTLKIVKEYAKKDKRIIIIKKHKNSGITSSLNIGLSLAKGEYIARMDDDDISLVQRFEKQVEFMDKNEDVAVLGTSFSVFSDKADNVLPSWDLEQEPQNIAFMLKFGCIIAHPCVFIRNCFLKKHRLKYLEEIKYAEDYALWIQILNRGGKIASLKDRLVKVRQHSNRSTYNSSAFEFQKKAVERIRTLSLKYFLPEECLKQVLYNFSFIVDRNKLYEILTQMKKNDPGYSSKETYDYMIQKYCGIKSRLHIFFACDENYVQHLCVTIASILKNSLEIEQFSFYILDGGLKAGKQYILELKQIKDFEIEFINVDEKLFEQSPKIVDYISKAGYYRYIIPMLKPNLEKCLYLDCDIVVEDSLNFLWNADLKDYYVGAVKDLWSTAHIFYKNAYNCNESFNSGVLLINIKQWLKDDISKQLFSNTKKLHSEYKMITGDQDILNYTFKDRWLALEPRYNVQTSFFSDEIQKGLYADTDLNTAKKYPVIIHYSGIKPWIKNANPHPLWRNYYHYLKFTAYKEKYFEYLCQNAQHNTSSTLENGATQKIKAHLSYQLGSALVEAKNPLKALLLPLTLPLIFLKFKISKALLSLLVKANPSLKPLDLSEYPDYSEALQVKKHLSYRLGSALIKNPFTFIFKARRIYREWKEERKW